MRTIAELLRWRARRHPDLVVLRQEGDAATPRQEITWAELDARTTALANGLIDLGVQPGDRVAILDKNSVAYMELLFAVAKLGAVSAPVNWRLAPPEVRTVVTESRATLCVAGEEFVPATAGVDARVVTFTDLPRIENGEDPHRDADPGAVAWQLYTSGTTGIPKGAMLTHDNLYACMPGILLECPEMREGTAALVAMPLYHIGGCGWAVACMYSGATLVVVREIVPAQLLRTIVDERIGTAFLVPAVLLFLSQLPGITEADFSHLHRILYGASPITPELLTRCIELFGCEFTQVYGLTETTGAISSLRLEDHSGDRLLSCGRANLGVDLRVVDAEGNDLPPGEVGELLIRAPQVMRGYHNREADTGAAIQDGWFHSGDAAALDAEGYIYIRDRIKDMIVTGGENVYPIEVESVIAEHPAVADVAVIGVPDHRWGETVKAVVVLRPGAVATEDDLVEFCKPRLAGFKRPTSVEFVESIPRNPTGKILKRELREQYWQGQARRVAGSGI
ncbi:MAG TPA: AMP-binding protein [Candidatus Dormibacteraeota bacterium]|nr:AMP-binding protein [Candidatus Dormibacteraeota bacterium]